MPEDTGPSRSRPQQIRLLLWLLVALAVIGAGALLILRPAQQATTKATATSFGGPFTLVGADGKPFPSSRLTGKPYAMYFGFTRCGDECPTTLSRLAKLRREAGPDDRLNILFVTIDPQHDGPKEVGQYATLFNTPIIGLTGSQAQIDQVKKQYGIYAAPNPHPSAGHELEHSTAVLLFGRDGKFVTTITPDEPDSSALEKIRHLIV